MDLCHVCANELKTRFAEAIDPQTKEKFAVLGCTNCGLAETHPRPENLDRYYADYHGGRHGFTAAYCAWRRGRFLEKGWRSNKQLKRVLDVGCGDMTFLNYAKKRGWQIVGTEFDTGRFKDSGLEIFADLREVKEKFGANSFEAVTFWHTLEHFHDPREVLKDAFELLAPKGMLFVAVPNARGWQGRLFGRFWLHLDVPRHLFHFDLNSLKLLLAQMRVEPNNYRHQEFEYDLLGWSQSALNAIFSEPNVFFKTLSGHKTKVSPAVRLMNVALGLALSMIALPLVLFGTLAKKGGTLVICAEKIDEVSAPHLC